jgi:hypothetical protein
VLERVCVEIPDSVKEPSADGVPKPFVCDELGVAILVVLRVSPGVLELVCVEIPDSVIERSADGVPKPFVCDEPGLCDDSLSVFVGETDVLTVTVAVTITLDDTTPEFELVALIVGNVAVADTETLVNPE